MTIGDFVPCPNYRLKVAEVELYTDPGDADQTEGVDGRYVVEKCGMNEPKLWRDAKRGKDIAKKV